MTSTKHKPRINRIPRINEKIHPPNKPRLASHARYACRELVLTGRFFNHMGFEPRPNNRLMHQTLLLTHPSLRQQNRKPRASPRATRRPVDRAFCVYGDVPLHDGIGCLTRFFEENNAVEVVFVQVEEVDVLGFDLASEFDESTVV